VAVLSKGAKLLLAWRTGQGISCNAAAKRFRVDRGNYMRWEDVPGCQPALRHAVALEDVAGIPVRSWLEDAEDVGAVAAAAA
jgi:hypothetical protein